MDNAWPLLPTPARPFGADTLACALTLTGKPTPTADELTAALGEMYPAGTGPAVPDLLAAGWLVPTVDGRGLRVPPLSLTEQDDRLAAHESKTALVFERISESDIPSLLAAHEIKSELVPAEVKNPVGGKLLPAGPLFSYYRGPISNTTPHANTTPGQLHQVITRPPRYLRERAAAARAAYGTPAYDALKKRLDYFSAGGTFTTRLDAKLLTASGLLVLDFDKMGGRVSEARAALLTDPALAPALVLLFVSPSGDGLKAVLRADPRHTRQVNYERLAKHLTKRYGWGPTLDKGTFDVSRACFLSYDPDAWLAPAYAA